MYQTSVIRRCDRIRTCDLCVPTQRSTKLSHAPIHLGYYINFEVRFQGVFEGDFFQNLLCVSIFDEKVIKTLFYAN